MVRTTLREADLGVMRQNKPATLGAMGEEYYSGLGYLLKLGWGFCNNKFTPCIRLRVFNLPVSV